MNRVSELSGALGPLAAEESGAQFREPSLNLTLAEQNQLGFSFCSSWDPYEVWCTRVRSESIGREPAASLLQPLIRQEMREVEENSSEVGRRRIRSIPVLAWPALLLAFTLGLNRELVGLFRVDLVGFVFGVMTPAARIVHVVLGLSTICAVIVALRPGRNRVRKTSQLDVEGAA
jgi:uncharacterized membrane protein YuzA (DUF378 family)